MRYNFKNLDVHRDVSIYMTSIVTAIPKDITKCKLLKGQSIFCVVIHALAGNITGESLNK